MDAPGRFVVRPAAGSLFSGLVLGGIFAVLGVWFANFARKDTTSPPFLPGVFSLLLLAIATFLVFGIIRSMVRPLLRADQGGIRPGHLPVVAWRDIREVTITRLETWKREPDGSGYNYRPSQLISLSCHHGTVHEWATPNADRPWIQDNLAAGLRRVAPAGTSIQISPTTTYVGGPKVLG